MTTADAIKKHSKSYGNDAAAADADAEENDKSLGMAAAMQALKMFSSGQVEGKKSQGAFMATAMSEATKVR